VSRSAGAAGTADASVRGRAFHARADGTSTRRAKDWHSSGVPAVHLVELGALVRDILRSDADHLQAARCHCALQAPAAVFGYWDALQLRVAISNLVSNAVKFGPGGPSRSASDR